MHLTRTVVLTAFLLLLGVTSAVAATFFEDFSGAALPPQLVPHADPGYAQMVASGKLNFGKADGTGIGTVFVQTTFLIGGDFTVSVIANRTDLSGGAKLGLRVVLGGSTADVFLDGTDGVEGVIKNQSATQMVAAATVTLQVRRTGKNVFCEYDSGSGFQTVQSLLGDLQLSKASARPEMILVQTGSSTAAESGNCDDFTVNAAHMSGGGATPTPTLTPVGATPTPRPSPTALDHFLSYVVKPTKGAAGFVPLGPVTLTDAFVPGGAGYDVAKPVALALPADKNGGGVYDAVTHLLEYSVKPSKGSPKFAPHVDVHLLNQCSDVFVTAKKPVSLLVPTAKDLNGPVAPPVEADHQLDHFLCYQAKAETKLANGTALAKFPKGMQVDVVDQFQSATRRYDLKAVTKLCIPVAKSGSPLFLKGPAKGTPAAITAADVRHAGSLLVCYKAKPATTEIPQLGCGPVNPKSKGTKIVPKPAKFTPVTGIFVNNQLGPLQLDATKELQLCVPSVLPII